MISVHQQLELVVDVRILLRTLVMRLQRSAYQPSRWTPNPSRRVDLLAILVPEFFHPWHDAQDRLLPAVTIHLHRDAMF